MLEPRDEGVTHIQRPRPGEFDVVLGSRPTPPKTGRSSARLVVYLLLFAVAGWLLSSQLFGARPQASVSMVTAPAVAQTQGPEPSAPEPDPQPVVQHIDISLPVTTTPQLATAAPQPLDKCLKQGNVIDQSVADCRFGPGGQPDTANTASSMVSAQYMAGYKSSQDRPAVKRHKPFQVAIVTLREWDGRNAYRAMWRISDNVIDNNSVCANFSGGSIERRECRRSAQVYFKEQCKEWGSRVENNGDEAGKVAQTRYCTATKTFDPSDG
ncbi:hypothetical protein [Pseudomonas sp. dw_358]|uniref:hypothetical protein n=1 Tax=Pseudomonas sp. dw_358 TaxID=2720083 RepID=UPI001BD63DE5|nr:hypothetical protein [Pseudomonas sp. dw_358]